MTFWENTVKESPWWKRNTAVPPMDEMPPEAEPSAPAELPWFLNRPKNIGAEMRDANLQSSRQELADTIKAQPEHKSRWWDKLGAIGEMAAGFGAGWSNAAGRARPIDIQAMGEGANNLLHPKFNKQLSDWNRKLNVSQNQYEMDKQAQAEAQKNRQLESEANARAAQAERDSAAAAYDTHRASVEQNQWKMDAKGRIINTVTGEVKNPAPTAQERFDEAKKLGVDDEAARFYALNGKMPEPRPDTSTSELEAYIKKHNGNVSAALADMQADKIRVSLASRPPREPSATEVARKEQDTIKALATRAMRDSRAGGGMDYEHAIANLQRFYPDDPEMNQYREQVIEQLNKWKIAGLKPEQLLAQIMNSGGSAPKPAGQQTTGGSQSAQTAAPKQTTPNRDPLGIR